MKNKLLLSVAACGAMAMISCSKESSTVAPDTQANMTYQLRAANVSGTTQRTTAGGTLVWTAGSANPTLVKFEARQQGTEIEYKSTNTVPVDLFAPTGISFGGFVLPPGMYKEIELKVRLSDEGTIPALHLEGAFTDNLGTIPIVLDVYDEIELKTEATDVEVDANTSIAAVTDLDLARYTSDFTSYLIRNATLTDGTLVISKSSNRSLYNRIVNNMRGHRHHCRYHKGR